jgi:hypothetical protein
MTPKNSVKLFSGRATSGIGAWCANDVSGGTRSRRQMATSDNENSSESADGLFPSSSRSSTPISGAISERSSASEVAVDGALEPYSNSSGSFTEGSSDSPETDYGERLADLSWYVYDSIREFPV